MPSSLTLLFPLPVLFPLPGLFPLPLLFALPVLFLLPRLFPLSGLFPLLLLFLLPGLPFFMFLPISCLLFKIQLRCHLCGTFSEATFPLTGLVAPGCSHHPSPFSMSVF